MLAGPDPDELEPVGTSPRHGFETALTVRTAEPYVAVRAKSASGRVLGATRAHQARRLNGVEHVLAGTFVGMTSLTLLLRLRDCGNGSLSSGRGA